MLALNPKLLPKDGVGLPALFVIDNAVTEALYSVQGDDDSGLGIKRY